MAAIASAVALFSSPSDCLGWSCFGSGNDRYEDVA
jgi:hypothetical protein